MILYNGQYKVATEIKIWDDNLKISTFVYEIKKQGLSGVFCYRWENKAKKKTQGRATFLLQHEFTLSHNSVIINAQIRAAGGRSDWRMYCCYNYNKFSNSHPFTYRVVYNGDLYNVSVCGWNVMVDVTTQNKPS